MKYAADLFSSLFCSFFGGKHRILISGSLCSFSLFLSRSLRLNQKGIFYFRRLSKTENAFCVDNASLQYLPLEKKRLLKYFCSSIWFADLSAEVSKLLF